MRIAFLTDESLPSGTRVHSKMMHELAVEFQRNDHSCVIIAPGSLKQKTLLEVVYHEGVEIWLFKSGKIRGLGMLNRVFNEWLIPYRAWKAISNEADNYNFDLCINYSPTIFFGPLAKKFKKNGAYIYLVLRDMFPQWLIDEGIIYKNSLAAFFLRKYEKINYDVADCIGVMSKKNLDLFIELNPSYSNVRILMNWVSTRSLNFPVTKSNILKKHNLSDKVIFFYGGNLGRSNDMPNLIRLARNLHNYKDAHFLIIGQGDQVDKIIKLKNSWNLKNLTILPSVSQDEYKGILKHIDVGLFTLSKKHSSHNFPGKLLGYMLQSKPILGSVNPQNDLSELINDAEAGCVFVNGEDKNLAKAALTLAQSPDLRLDMGEKARLLLDKHFSVESAVQNIIFEKNKK